MIDPGPRTQQHCHRIQNSSLVLVQFNVPNRPLCPFTYLLIIYTWLISNSKINSENLNVATVITIADLETLLPRLHTRNAFTCLPMKQLLDEFQDYDGHSQF